jgi:hypothetical protein
MVSYNASVIKIYSTSGSLVRFENKNISFHFEKRFSALQRGRYYYVVVNSEVVGFAPGLCKLSTTQSLRLKENDNAK